MSCSLSSRARGRCSATAFRPPAPVPILAGAGALLAAVPRCRDGHRRAALVGASVALLGVFVWAWLPDATRRDVLHAAPVAALVLAAIALLAASVAMAWASRFAALAPLLVLYALAGLVIYGGEPPSPIFGWGLIALPPFLAGLLLGSAVAAGRRGQAVCLLLWLIFVATIATDRYMNVMDEQGWLAAYAVGRHQSGELTAGEAAALVAGTRQTTLTATATYLAATLGSLGLAWLLGARWPWRPGQSAPRRRMGRS